MSEQDEADRRVAGDRRERPGDDVRRHVRKPASPVVYVLRSLGLIIALLGVIYYALENTRPIYAGRGTLAEELRKRSDAIPAPVAAGDSSQTDQLMATPKFQDEKRNFFEDLMRLKQVDSARADSIAQYAVREAYVRGISPAIVFGVMLTENAKFISNATSNVGAVGLMQVYPKIWLTKEMSALFGRDLATDSTNVKYGVFILSKYFNPRTKAGTVRERDWATALLHYNGCVTGSNTPNCKRYPSKVKTFVERSAKSICDGRGFYDCIAKPFVQGLFGSTDSSSTRATK
ncbi:MAG: transglycosylase SLT domain-containing protein [bacterium]